MVQGINLKSPLQLDLGLHVLRDQRSLEGKFLKVFLKEGH